jgi:hypothetical protein
MPCSAEYTYHSPVVAAADALPAIRKAGAAADHSPRGMIIIHSIVAIDQGETPAQPLFCRV